MWQVSSRSGEASCELLYSVYFTGLSISGLTPPFLVGYGYGTLCPFYIALPAPLDAQRFDPSIARKYRDVARSSLWDWMRRPRRAAEIKYPAARRKTAPPTEIYGVAPCDQRQNDKRAAHFSARSAPSRPPAGRV